MWNRRAILIYPVDGLTELQKDTLAQAFVTHAALETFANERLMFDKAVPVSGDYGATETHRQISTALTPALADAVTAALTGMSGFWYLLDADTDELLDTNDAAKDDHGLDYEVGVSVVDGEILRYEGGLIEVLQNHTTAIQWPPHDAVSLYRRYLAPGGDPVPWAQPGYAEQTYPLNFRVTHVGKTWRSNHPFNSWEPGAQGSEALWIDESLPPATPIWTVGVVYHLNDEVLHNGVLYRCMQPTLTAFAHQQPGAPGMLALWQPVP